MGMSAGRLDRTIALQQPTEVINAIGETVQTWSTVANLAASYKPLNSTERFSSDAIRADRAAKFYIRYRDGITGKMRVVFGTEIYRIIAINEIERRVGIELICEAVQ